ncbi:hypothetical protein HELRODRAFT_182539 [Helobdella robusta]|uniref:Uncharacterized protein n=1 Tax=Helobdella robusta TaxID=6412 RepID=T1FIC0_HELRO|nr:hypothetical protein HELRODRAFT_182539 [Helobdella robusta]ESN90830.1 hypothetical protein HELRODRAFT_182539 [Helobdella robusta]
MFGQAIADANCKVLCPILKCTKGGGSLVFEPGLCNCSSRRLFHYTIEPPIIQILPNLYCKHDAIIHSSGRIIQHIAVWVLRSALNFASDREVVREGGREFQRKGPEKAKADLAKECLTRVKKKREEEDDRKPGLLG